MAAKIDLTEFAGMLEKRLDAIDRKLDTLTRARRKGMEWVGTLSEHIASLDAFREEVRATFEPLLAKLEAAEEMTRVLRHATHDVSRRLEALEAQRRQAG